MHRSARRIVLFAVTGLATAAAAVQAAPIAAHRVASAAHVNLDVRAAVLTKTAATTWTGKALSPQLGSGKLTLVGTVTFRSDGEATPRSVLRFRATFKSGFVSGCLHNVTRLRPGSRQVWDGPGQVTSSSSSLRRYRGLKVRGGGVSPADDLTHAKPFGFSTRSPGTQC